MNIPHFDLPFRFAGLTAAVVEQDSSKDVTNCVEAALRTTRGTRLYVPDFGIDDPTFEKLPVDVNKIKAQVLRNEPRAGLDLMQWTDMLDVLITQITVGVSQSGNQ